MKTMRLMLVGVLAVAMGLTTLAVEPVKQSQTINLIPGWNATYIEVAPNESADEIFRDWPVDWVAAYDSAAFLETKQYSGTSSTEGTSESGFVVWRRAEGPLSPMKGVAANCIYVCFNTNTTDYSQTLYGRPAAPRITWHPSSTNEPMNYIGLLVAAGEKTTIDDYFNGADIGNVTYQYIMQGVNPEKPSFVPVNGATEFTSGDVVVMTSSKVSDWSGVLNVSPIGGLDFSTNLNYKTLTVRNDGAKARTVRIALDSGDIPAGGNRPIPPEQLLIRDAVATNNWASFAAGSVSAFTKELAAGETLTLEIALDRTKLTTAAGFYYGGLLKIDDADGKSNMRVTLPIEVTSDGGVSNSKAWPKGTWLAAGEFDRVSFIQRAANGDGYDNTPVKAGGKMKVRLPLYVECDGAITLLQRFVFGTDTNGVTHIYSAQTEDSFPVAIGNMKRVSSAVLPIDQPIIKAANGTFGTEVAFDFTVSENSKVNPFRHVFHPSHDGLGWDFETPTPSGDNLRNYISTVKPELFSVTNRISFAWDPSTGSMWTPEEKLSGDLTWELEGVRHEGTILMKGRFSMTRISDCDLDK